MTVSPNMEQRLHRFNQHIDIVSRVVSYDTLHLNNPESDVEYTGGDEVIRSDYLTIYWSHQDYDKICTIPHQDDDERIITRVMEIAESVAYDRDRFEKAVVAQLGTDENDAIALPHNLINEILDYVKHEVEAADREDWAGRHFEQILKDGDVQLVPSFYFQLRNLVK